MLIVSFLLAFAAFVSLVLGLLLTPVPIWGAVFSFGAPMLALSGIVIAGMKMSEATKRAQPSGVALTSVILNVLAFLPALVVAMTCGVCNACVSSQGGMNQVQFGPMLQQQGQRPIAADAGPPPPPFPNDPTPTRTTGDAGANNPAPTPVQPDLPPPPIAPGPKSK